MALRDMIVAAVLLLAVSGARAQTNTPDFNGLDDNSLFFSYGPFPTTANPRSALVLSNATSLRTSDQDNRIFYIKPCESFVPHWHPNASELAVGQTGVMTVNILFNGRLVQRQIEEGDQVLFPQNALHWFYNNGCTQATIVSTLNSNAPGLAALYDPPSTITDGDFTLEEFQEFATRTPNSTLDRARAFPPLTSDCQARCFPPPSPPSSAPQPTRRHGPSGGNGSYGGDGKEEKVYFCFLGVRFSVGKDGYLFKLAGDC